MYYATRASNDKYWGKKINNLHFSPWYLDCMADLKFVMGNAAFQMLRGPMFSGTLKSGVFSSRGQFNLSAFSEEELRTRLLFGPAIPSVRAVNEATSDATLTCGGMSEPLRLTVVELRTTYRDRIEELLPEPPPRLDCESLKRKLADSPMLDREAVGRELHGTGHAPKLKEPKKPRRGPNEVVPWWEQDLSQVEES